MPHGVGPQSAFREINSYFVMFAVASLFVATVIGVIVCSELSRQNALFLIVPVSVAVTLIQRRAPTPVLSLFNTSPGIPSLAESIRMFFSKLLIPTPPLDAR